MGLLHVLKKRIAIIIALPIVFGVSTAVVCWGFMPDQYTSEVSLYLFAPGETSQSVNMAVPTDSGDSKELASDVTVIAKSDQVGENAMRVLGLSSLKGYRITVLGTQTNRMVTISVTGRDPESVAMVADEMAHQTAEAAVATMGLGGANVVNVAKVAAAPSGPYRIEYTLAATAIGLVLALIITFVLNLFNKSIRSKAEAEEYLGIPVVGKMPFVKDLR